MTLPAEVEVAVIGAGAAGVSAGLRLRELGAAFVILEARPRIGGRAHTVQTRLGAFDLGCGWLHSADENPWAPIFEGLGLALDRTEPPWGKPAIPVNFPPEAQREFRAAFSALEAQLEAAAEAPADRPASELLEPGGRWNGLLNSFSGAFNGAAFDRVSVKDYAAYADTGVNWRVLDGYGAAIARAAQELPVALDCPARRVALAPPGVRIATAQGEVRARAAVITLPTDVLAEGAVAFDPPLPRKAEAAADLPLGCVNKAFLALAGAEEFPPESRLYGRTDTERTANYHVRPFGRPAVEAYFGGALAAELEREGPGALAAFAIEEWAAAFGSDMRPRLSPLAASAWRTDPWSRGAYSHAKVGRAGQRAVLAAPVEGRLFFAGEACSEHAYSTAHGAFTTGRAAADAALAAVGRAP